MKYSEKEHKPKVRVQIIESERGWGQRIDETIYFDTKEEAELYCKEYNSKNNEASVPEWYMYASIQ